MKSFPTSRPVAELIYHLAVGGFVFCKFDEWGDPFLKGLFIFSTVMFLLGGLIASLKIDLREVNYRMSIGITLIASVALFTQFGYGYRDSITVSVMTMFLINLLACFWCACGWGVKKVWLYLF